MTAAAEQFERLLDDERAAAVASDLDALVRLQQAKQEAMESLRESGMSRNDSERLARKASTNLRLMRHLVGCLRALAFPEGEAYSAKGQRFHSVSSRGQSRGVY